MITKLFKYLLAIVMIASLQTPVQANEDECVILVHGLARTSQSMEPIYQALVRENYQVVNMSYPSRKYQIQKLAKVYVEKAVKECRRKKVNQIHFVTHSLGGILVRYYLKNYNLSELGRVVMLSPPNQGSEIVDTLASTRLFYWINGPAGLQLNTKYFSIPNQLGSIDYPVGIITGNKSLNPLFSSWIPGQDDGKVSVESAKLDGMKDFLVVPHSHTYIMRSKEVIRQTINFLKAENFERESLM